MISLAHFDLGPLIYGVVMFFGIANNVVEAY